MAARPVAAAPSAVVHVAPSGVAHPSSGMRVVTRGTPVRVHPGTQIVRATPRRPNGSRPVAQDLDFNGDFYPVPGLGFDVTHVAATRGPRAVGAGRHNRNFGAFFPFFDGGLFLASPTVVEEAPPVETQQPESVQPDEVESTQRMRYREQAPAPVAAPVETAASQRESEQYVFVRRDGTIIFAVAYTWDNGSLRYVTTEGLRRSVALNLLDLDATKQFNEQRGLSFRLPA
jgi:hypothetical protein